MKSKNVWSSKLAVLGVLVLAGILTLGANTFAETSSTSGKININTADSGQLATLPGIGYSKAQAIVDYRAEHGPFPTIESLANVQGIGMKLVERIRPFINNINQ